MPAQFRDYYRALGVPRTASPDEIRKAFRRLAREHHPDVAKNKSTAEERFKEINEAYEVLGDPEKRRRYDEMGENPPRPTGFGSAPRGTRRRSSSQRSSDFEFSFDGTGFSDFFAQFFGGRHGRSGFGPEAGFDSDDEPTGFSTEDEPGTDMAGDIMVTLGEVLNGSVRSISLQRTHSRTGEAGSNTFQVRIPAGVREGQRIRVRGQGGKSRVGGPPGDLYLTVRYARHPDFRVEGADLHYDLELAPWEAVLGATVRLTTLDGTVTLKVPPGTTSGQSLRLQGRGLPLGNEPRGDLFAHVSIQVPKKLTEKEKALWKALQEGSSFSPRFSLDG